jgi:hypothetical protein
MRRTLVVALAFVFMFGLMAGPAFAFHCYVEDKPNGAGAVTFADLKVAGNSGKLVAPGAFISTEVTGLDHDLFIRGKPAEDPLVVGEGSLPEQPHTRGSDEHGVQDILNH